MNLSFAATPAGLGGSQTENSTGRCVSLLCSSMAGLLVMSYLTLAEFPLNCGHQFVPSDIKMIGARRLFFGFVPPLLDLPEPR